MAETEEVEEVACQAVQERRGLITQLKWAAEPHNMVREEVKGTESELVSATSVLQGIVNEYRDGGDQMVENCTCGKHTAKFEPMIDSPRALLHWLWRAQVKWTQDSLDQDLRMNWFSDDGYDYSTSALALAELMYDFHLDQRYDDLYALLLTGYNDTDSPNRPERQLWDYATDGIAPEFYMFPALDDIDAA